MMSFKEPLSGDRHYTSSEPYNYHSSLLSSHAPTETDSMFEASNIDKEN